MTVQYKYIPGDHYVICDRCGWKKRRSEVRKEWTGSIVCADPCYDPPHPQDNIRPKMEKQSVKNARPEAEDVFITEAPVDGSEL